MTTGEKIARLRKENNYTQEQLAEILGVSRQSVSKYESNLAYPETEKLIRLSEVFDCTVDYLLKDSTIKGEATKEEHNGQENVLGDFFKRILNFDKKSKRIVCGLPLWHIGKNAKGFIAVGLKAQGVVTLGLLSIGIFSLGFFSIGLLAIGLFAIGLLAAGSIAIGGIACGAISVGVLAVGAIAIGKFSIGALSIGHYFAYGDQASAMFAFGDTKASGTLYEGLKDLSVGEKKVVIDNMKQNIPSIYHWIIEWVSNLI